MRFMTQSWTQTQQFKSTKLYHKMAPLIESRNINKWNLLQGLKINITHLHGGYFMKIWDSGQIVTVLQSNLTHNQMSNCWHTTRDTPLHLCILLINCGVSLQYEISIKLVKQFMGNKWSPFMVKHTLCTFCMVLAKCPKE